MPSFQIKSPDVQQIKDQTEIRYGFIKFVKGNPMQSNEDQDPFQYLTKKNSKRNLQACTISAKQSQQIYTYNNLGQRTLGDWSMLFTNSNPGSCSFSGCSITTQSGCTFKYSSVDNGCSAITLQVSSNGVLSIANIASPYKCCQYVMQCQVNGQIQTSNPFLIYVSETQNCNDNDSGRTYLDILPSSTPPNKNYIVGQGISNIFQEEVLISDYFYFPNNFDSRQITLTSSQYYACTCGSCTYAPACIISSCQLVDSATLTNIIISFQIFPFPNSTFVFKVQTSSSYNQQSVKLKCTSPSYGSSDYFYSNPFYFSITATTSTVITITGSQQQTFNLANYISSSTGSCDSFSNTVTSCQIQQNGQQISFLISSSLSGTNFNFLLNESQLTQTGIYTLFCTLSNGLTFSNVFTIQLNQCFPALTLNSLYSKTIASEVTPFQVFTAASSDSNSNCNRQSFKLYDSTGLIDVSTSSTNYNFNTATGEFKITSFTGYFNMNFYVEVTYLHSTLLTTKSVKQQVNVLYQVGQIDCFSQINIGNFIYSLNSLTTPYQVFKVQNLLQNQDTLLYCQFDSYTLYDSKGKNTMPQASPASAQYSFNQKTGELKITSFSGYFYLQVIVQVNGVYKPTSLKISKNSSVITVNYVVCSITFSGIGNFLNQVTSFAYPYTLFTASTYFSTLSPCTLSYKILSYPSGADITSYKSPFQFSQQSGKFVIISQTKINIFEFNITIQASASYNSSKASQSTQQIIIRQVICKPSLSGLSNKFFYSVNILKFPYTVFNSQQYSSTTNPTYCSLTYSATNLDGSSISLQNQYMKCDSKTGLFQIYSYQWSNYYVFVKKINLKVTSKYLKSSSFGQNITQQISIDICTCAPSILNSYIKDSYNITVSQDASISNPQVVTILQADTMTLNPSDSVLCYLKYQSYFQNGTKATNSNSKFYNDGQKMILTITSNVNSSQKYYFTATSWSKSPVYGYYDESKIFTINVIAYPNKTAAQTLDQSNSSSGADIQKQNQFEDTNLTDTDTQDESANGKDNNQVQKNQDKSSCSNDIIQQLKSMPLHNEPQFHKYKLTDGNPVLYLNLSQQESMNVDIKSRFQNSMQKSCSLSYLIYEISFSNGSSVNRTITNSFISLFSHGIFSVKKQNKYAFEHYQIYIVAYNQARKSSSKSGYMIDLSIYQKQSLKDQDQSQIQLSKKLACKGYISNVNQKGIVKIMFNDIMSTFINISSINNTNTEMYIKAGGGRQEDDDFDPSTLNFTWKVASFNKDTMFIRLNFSQPLQISPLNLQDSLVINFYQSKDLIICKSRNSMLNEENSILIHNIPPQVSLTQNSQMNSIETSGQIFSDGPMWLLASGGGIVLLGYGKLEFYLIYVRTLQFILLIPGLPIVLPANVIDYFIMIKSVANYDILSYINMWNLPGLNQIIVDPNAPVKISDQMQNVGYQNRNALYGLGTFTFLIFLYFIRLLLVMIMKIILKIQKKKCIKKKKVEIMQNGLFFNELFELAIEGMIEFSINGYLNLMTVQKTTGGELLGASLSGFCLFMIIIMLPLTIMWMICFKSRTQLQSEKFDRSFGALFYALNLKWTSSRFYYLVFWARRLISICISLFAKPQMASVVLVLILIFNILYTIYVGRQKRFLNRKLTFLEWFNELSVSGCYYMMIILTDWVPSQAVKFSHGFMITYLVIYYSFVNILTILYVNLKSILIVFQKYSNLIQNYFMQKKSFQNDRETEIQELDQNNLGQDIKKEILQNPNILELNTIDASSQMNIKQNDLLMNNDKKLNDIFEKIKLQIQSQKEFKKENNFKWQKENQQKTLKKLIKEPKLFIKPNLQIIKEENDQTVLPNTLIEAAIQSLPIQKSSSQEQIEKDIENLPKKFEFNQQINPDEFIKKHIELQEIDTDGSLKKNVENIFEIINSPNYDDLIQGARKSDLIQSRDLMKIDLLLLKTSLSYKEQKLWEKKIDMFEKDLNQILTGYL